MRDILNDVKAALAKHNKDGIYFAFDTVPSDRKGETYTLLGINSYEAMTPVYSQYTVFMPFKAEIEITVSAPMLTPMSALYGYFEEKIQPAIDDMSGLSGKLCRLSIKQDSNLKRFLLTAGVSAGGVRRIERKSL